MDELEGVPGREEFALHQGALTTLTAFTRTFETVGRSAEAARAGPQREEKTFPLARKGGEPARWETERGGKQPSCARRERQLASKKARAMEECTLSGGDSPWQSARKAAYGARLRNGGVCAGKGSGNGATVKARARIFALEAYDDDLFLCADTCTDEQELALFAVFKRKHLRQIAQEYPFVGSEKTGWIFGSEKFLTQRVCRAVVVGALELHERRGQQILVQRGEMQA